MAEGRLETESLVDYSNLEQSIEVGFWEVLDMDECAELIWSFDCSFPVELLELL